MKGIPQEMTLGADGTYTLDGVMLNPEKEYAFLFWADGGERDYAADDLTAVRLAEGAASAGIAFQAKTEWDGSSTDIEVELTHAVTKLTLRSTTAVEEGRAFALSNLTEYNGFDVLAGAAAGETVALAHGGTGTGAAGDLLTFYALVGGETQELRLTSGVGGGEKPVSNVSLAADTHVILQGDVQNAGWTTADFTATVAEEWGGTVTKVIGLEIADDDTYVVSSPAALQAWAEAARSTPSTDCTLAADIDMSRQSWTPVGNSLGNPYTGTFDGAGYSISNLSSNTVGLFNYVSSGTIKNLIMETPQINTGNGGNNIGIIVGRLDGGTVENCHVVGGSISKNVSVGGVVGSVLNGTVRACSSSATVYVRLWNGGGIVGYNNGTVIACYAIGQVTGGERIGAVIGENNNTITACYWSGTSTYGWYNFTAWNSSYTPVSDNKVDDSTITWTIAAENMNAALGADYGWQWVENTDDATKASRPLILVEKAD